MASTQSIQTAVEAHLKSYAVTVGPKSEQEDIMAGAVAIVSHLLEDTVLFDHGMLVMLGNGEKAANLHRQKLEEKGIGVEFRLKGHTCNNNINISKVNYKLFLS